ncbi:MAG: hypothetical protein WAV09_04910 [Minisyncoccia bacterium]
MNTKLLYSIGLGILLVLLGVGAYMYLGRTEVVPVVDETPIVNEQQGAVTYRNNIYGFTVPLPDSWRGYSVKEEPKGSYLEIHIMHPQSTAENPRMDVPVLVVPVATWNKWYPVGAPESGQHPFAAPVPATERARNTKYVFATAPRYNFSYLTGFEEVDEIVKKITALNIFPTQTTQPTQTNTRVETFPLFEEGEVKG